MGYDSQAFGGNIADYNFNSRTPCGVQRQAGTFNPSSSAFQLTYPVWGTTLLASSPASMTLFQLTYPVWGTTRSCDKICTTQKFQLTYPVWGTTFSINNGTKNTLISTHVPRVGYDILHKLHGQKRTDFNSRTPCGVRLITL